MPKIKLTQSGMTNYSGHLGTVLFENGISVESPSSAEINRLAALTRLETIDDDGKEAGQAGLAAKMAGSRSVPAPVVKPSKRGEAEPYQVEKNAPDIQIGGRKKPKPDFIDDTKAELEDLMLDVDVNEAADEAQVSPKIYSQEELEQIADKDGINGLRKIANPLGVKDNSIAGLIKEIVQGQGRG